MTGLTQRTSEALQVQNYGIGGHYVPHWDHRIKRESPFNTTGNRIATTLFYVLSSYYIDILWIARKITSRSIF